MIAALVRFSVRRPGVVLALALTVTVYGLHRLLLASLDVFPEFSPTQVVIQTEAPGFNSQLTESLVTRPIEAAIAGIPGLASVRSQSIPGLSVVTAVSARAPTSTATASRLRSAWPPRRPSFPPASHPASRPSLPRPARCWASASLQGAAR